MSNHRPLLFEIDWVDRKPLVVGKRITDEMLSEDSISSDWTGPIVRPSIN